MLTLGIHFCRYLLKREPANFTHARGHLSNTGSPQQSKPTSYNPLVNNSLLNHSWAYLYFFIMSLAYLQHTQDLQNVIHHFTLEITIFPLRFLKNKLLQENKVDVSLSVEKTFYFTRRLKSFLDVCFKLLVLPLS